MAPPPRTGAGSTGGSAGAGLPPLSDPMAPGAEGLGAAFATLASGGTGSADRLFALLYADLHRIARSRMRQAGELTLLDTTGLVHESWLRLRAAAPQQFPDHHRFLAYAARAMRSVVVDLVRSRQAERHGGGLDRLTWHTGLAEGAHRSGDEVLRVHEALVDLAATEPRLATVVELRYFGGLCEVEVASALGVTVRTVQRDWAKARLYLSLTLR